ncbi:hypothetical protein C8J57DRAFT_1482200 [Mycena rebaudengoi]|nr:hypothetical protein C8J57DRAFT_1482200 [Mycena rebaudengoi]
MRPRVACARALRSAIRRKRVERFGPGAAESAANGNGANANVNGANTDANGANINGANANVDSANANTNDSAPHNPEAPLEYNVFVLDADVREMRRALPELMMRVFEGGERRAREAGDSAGARAPGAEAMQVDGEVGSGATSTTPAEGASAAPTNDEPNTVDFGQRKRGEMRELTAASEILSVLGGRGGEGRRAEEDERGREDLSNTTTASHWRPLVGQVFLGNSGDVPLGAQEGEDPFFYEGTNDPREGMGYDVCVECHEMAPFPSLAHLRAAEEHLTMLDGMWEERVRELGEGAEGETRLRPPPNANAVIHLPFPSAPSNTVQTMNSLLPVVAFLERCLRPVVPPTPAPPNANNTNTTSDSVSPRRWSGFPIASASPAIFFPSPPAPRSRALTSPSPSLAQRGIAARTRPLKVLIYSSDGYTESSPLALSLLMAVRRLTLPEAYLELQVAKRRSFFVYPGELGLLRRVEGRIGGGEVFPPSKGMSRRMSGAGGMGRGA